MSAQPVPQPYQEQPHNEQFHNEAPKLGSPYCSDPNCEYCKEMRRAQELVSWSENLSRG